MCGWCFRRTLFQGSFGLMGSFSVSRRCKAGPTESVNFKKGDHWLGHFLCDRPTTENAKIKENEMHVHGVSMDVYSMDDKDGSLKVGFTSDLVTTGTVFSYTAEGEFDALSPCRSLQITPTPSLDAWTAGRVDEAGVVTRQWSAAFVQHVVFFQLHLLLIRGRFCRTGNMVPLANMSSFSTCNFL